MHPTNVIPWTGSKGRENTENKMTKQDYFELALTRGSSQSRPQYSGACIPSPWRFPAVWWKSHRLETEGEITQTHGQIFLNFFFHFLYRELFHFKWDIFYLERNTSQNDCGHEMKTTLFMIHLQNLCNTSDVFENRTNLEFEMLKKNNHSKCLGWYIGWAWLKLWAS